MLVSLSWGTVSGRLQVACRSRPTRSGRHSGRGCAKQMHRAFCGWQSTRSLHSSDVSAVIELLEDRALLSLGALDASFSSDGLVTTDFFHNARSFDTTRAIAIQADGKIIAVGTGGYFTRYQSNGSIDTSFGEQGRVKFDGTANAVVLQEDGKVVVAGTSPRDLDFAVARYNADGSLDTSFDGDGKITTEFGSGLDECLSLALQSDGKIVAAGRSGPFTSRKFALARYNADGTLDTSFDSDGMLTSDFGGNSLDGARSVAIQSDGKIVVAGSAQFHFAVVRYNPDGTFDSSFDNDGKCITAFGISTDTGSSLALQSDGKIVVAGTTSTGINSSFAVLRHNADGTLDASFGNNGKLTTDITNERDYGYAVALQNDGKIVVAGASSNSTDFAVARYNVDGTLDTSFDGDGKLITDFGGSDTAFSVGLQSDGKLVAAGPSHKPDQVAFAVVRYQLDGSLDSSFDGDGMITTHIGSSDESANSVALQRDGKIVVAGYVSDGSNPDFGVARYNADGTLDLSFDGDGMLTTDIGNGYSRGSCVVVQNDGKIVVAGESGSYGNFDIAVARYNSEGTLDMSFDGDGMVATDFMGNDEYGSSVVLQPDGKIVVAGRSGTFKNYDFAMVRYNADGTLDRSFDGDGMLTTDFSGSDDNYFSIALQNDGKIVVAGARALARFNSDGTLDTSFGSDGKVITDYRVTALAIQNDGRIVAAGYAGNDFGVMRFNIDGTLDNSFDGDGKLYTDFVGSSDVASSLALQSNGQIVVAGHANNGRDLDFALLRYNADGTLDRSFDGDGKLTVAFGRDYDRANGVVLQNDGQIVVAGTTFNGSNNDFAVARFLATDNFVVNLPNATNNVVVRVSEAMLIVEMLDGTKLLGPVPASSVLSLTINGGSMVDTITVDASVNGTLSHAYSVPLILSGSDGHDVLNARASAYAVELNGGAGNDSLTGGAGSDSINGGSGNDTITCGAGDDKVTAASGADLISGSDGLDTLFGGTGNDTIDGGLGSDIVNGQDNDDSLLGGAGHDRLTGDTGNDTLRGDLGADTLSGSDGNDRLFGADDDDVLQGGNGLDSLDGGSGADVLRGDAGNDTLFGQAGTDSLVGGADDDSLDGGNDSDTLLGDFGNDTLRGGNGDDRLTGLAGDDLMDGGAGTDFVTEKSDADVVVIGTNFSSSAMGNDTTTGVERLHVQGGSGNNTFDARAATMIVRLYGNDGNDTLLGGSKADSLIGGSGDDVLSGGAGNDVLDGGDGTDFVYEVANTDFTLNATQLLSAATGTETLTSIEQVVLVGGVGNNRFEATQASVPVILLGGAGNDTLIGGTQSDVLIGGSRANVSAGTDSLVGNAAADSMDNDAADSRVIDGLDTITASVLASIPSWIDSI